MIINLFKKGLTAFIISPLLLVSIITHSQATFQKSYISPSYVQYINNYVAQLPGAGFVIAGTGINLTETDERGDVLWSEQFYDSTSYYKQSYTGALHTTLDGGIIVGASTIYVNSALGINHYYMYIVKTDATGNIIWSNLYGDSNEGGCSGSTGSFVSSLKQTSDSGYIAIGFTNDFGFGCTNGMYVLKTDKNGNQQWSETFAISGNIRTDGDIIEVTGGGYLAIGAGDILRLGSTGNLLWAKSFGGGYGAGIQSTPGGYYVGFGSTLCKTDTSGNVIWSNNYNTQLASIAATADSGCVVTGTSNSYSGAMLVKINSDGTVAFAGSYGGSGIGGNTVLQTSDNGFAIVGYTAINNSYLYFIKTDPLGNAGCSQEAANISASKVTVTPTSLSPGPVMRSSEVFNPSTILSRITTTVDSICASVSTGLSASASKTDAGCYGLCNGTAKANPVGGTSPYTFLWNTNPLDTSQAITGLCAGSYVVTITDHAGDTATAGVMIAQPVAIVNILTAAKDSVCPGDTATLTETGNAASLLWQSANTGADFVSIPGADDSMYSDVLSQTTIFRVIAHNGSCADTSAPITVVVDSLPAPPIVTTTDSIICSSDSTQICIPNLFKSYLWNTGDTSSCTIAKAAGGYWVTITDANGCSAVSNHQPVSVYPVPSVSITVQGDTLSSFGAVSYQWFLNGDSIPDASSPVYIARQSGNYSVEVTDSNGCKALSANTQVVFTGINQADYNTLSIYPNPFTDKIFIKEDGTGMVLRNIKIYDIVGRIVLNNEYNYTGPLMLQLDLSSLPQGAYYIKLVTNETEAMHCLIKQ